MNSLLLMVFFGVYGDGECPCGAACRCAAPSHEQTAPAAGHGGRDAQTGLHDQTGLAGAVPTAQAEFLAWLNRERAGQGLLAVQYSPDLEKWAALNNTHQRSRGLGHYVLGPASRQNAAMAATVMAAAPMWLNSPPHRSGLFDASIRWIGVAGDGTWATWNGSSAVEAPTLMPRAGEPVAGETRVSSAPPVATPRAWHRGWRRRCCR